jgi:hypothetical protein
MTSNYQKAKDRYFKSISDLARAKMNGKNIAAKAKRAAKNYQKFKEAERHLK